jgi:putative membrane protein
MEQLGKTVLYTFTFTMIGLLFFAFAFWLIVKISPSSIRKEIEEDQNTALAILIASVIIGISLIVSSAIH